MKNKVRSMLIIFLDTKVITVHNKSVLAGQAVNSIYHCDVMERTVWRVSQGTVWGTWVAVVVSSHYFGRCPWQFLLPLGPTNSKYPVINLSFTAAVPETG
jgi:hypothetical protein